MRLGLVSRVIVTDRSSDGEVLRSLRTSSPMGTPLSPTSANLNR